jgi:hypothetical protein
VLLGDSYPKGTIDLSLADLHIPESPPSDHRFMFELHAKSHISSTSSSQSDPRVFPLAAENDGDMFAWLNRIRRAQLYYSNLSKIPAAAASLPNTEHKKSTADPKANTAGVIGKGSQRGFLTKQGGKWRSWNKRWFVLADDVLWYFKKEPTDADTPEGGITLRGAESGNGEEKVKKKFCMSLLTDERTFFLCAENETEMNTWITAINEVADRATKRAPVNFCDANIFPIKKR